jgi:hypothetical protein
MECEDITKDCLYGKFQKLHEITGYQYKLVLTGRCVRLYASTSPIFCFTIKRKG